MSKVALIGYEEPQVNGKLNDNQLFVIKETCKLTIRILWITPEERDMRIVSSGASADYQTIEAIERIIHIPASDILELPALQTYSSPESIEALRSLVSQWSLLIVIAPRSHVSWFARMLWYNDKGAPTDAIVLNTEKR